MTKEILFILACVPLYVINSFCDKAISKREENSFTYNSIKFLICSICTLPLLLTDKSTWGIGSLFCGIGCGIMYAVSKTVMLKGYKETSVAFMTLCHSSGMILPCILGHFFWDERLTPVSVVGIALAITAIVLLKGGSNNGFKAKGVVFGLIIFLTSAGVMVAQKLMGLYFSNEGVSAYNLCSFVVAFLIISLNRTVKIRGCKSFTVFSALSSALCLVIISLVMTNLSGSVPSAILFPLFNGMGIIFVCVGSIFVFGEKLTVKKSIGLFLGVLGLYLINL